MSGHYRFLIGGATWFLLIVSTDLLGIYARGGGVPDANLVWIIATVLGALIALGVCRLPGFFGRRNLRHIRNIFLSIESGALVYTLFWIIRIGNRTDSISATASTLFYCVTGMGLAAVVGLVLGLVFFGISSFLVNACEPSEEKSKPGS